MCQGSNYRIKVSLLFSLILGFPPNLFFSPCPVAPSLLTFLTAFPYLPKGKLTFGEISENIYLKKPLRAAVGTRQFKPRQRRVSCDCRRGLRIVLMIPVRAFFSLVLFHRTLLFKAMSRVWPPSSSPLCWACSGSHDSRSALKHHGMHKDLCIFFLILYFSHEVVNFQVMNIQFVQIWQSDA